MTETSETDISAAHTSALNESDFYALAQDYFEHIALGIEACQALDHDQTEQSLTLHLPKGDALKGKIYLFNIHKGMRQIWMASPVSGGRHFEYTAQGWRDTRTKHFLGEVLMQELRDVYGIHISFKNG